MTQTGNYGGFGYSDGGVKYIQCVRCQATHFEDEPLFEGHLYYQSKHGIFTMSKEDFQKMRLKQVERDTLAAELAEFEARKYFVLRDDEILKVSQWDCDALLFKLSRRVEGVEYFFAHEVSKRKLELAQRSARQFEVLIEFLIRGLEAEIRKAGFQP